MPESDITDGYRHSYEPASSSHHRPRKPSPLPMNMVSSDQRNDITVSTSHAGCSLCTMIANAKPKPSPQQSTRHQTPQPQQFTEERDGEWTTLSLTTDQSAHPSPRLSRFSSVEGSPNHSPNASPRGLEHATHLPTESSDVDGNKTLYVDRDLTAWTVRPKDALASRGRHLVIALNSHTESVYDLVSRFIPAG